MHIIWVYIDLKRFFSYFNSPVEGKKLGVWGEAPK
jgi:hypothetical protein